MDFAWMDFGAVSGRAAIAIIGAALFACVALSWQALSRTRRPGRRRQVRLSGDRLQFAPGKYQVSVADYLLRSAQLAREFSKALKHEVRVRTVIAVPGWEIEDQSNELCLVVNERNLVMLRGWKDPNDYLMNEDVEALHDLLGQRCTV